MAAQSKARHRYADYVVISCQNRWNISELHSAILKECGYSVVLSSAKTVSGNHKVAVTFEGTGKLPFVAEATASGTIDNGEERAETETTKPLELDPQDVNDIIRALNEARFTRYIILEDFHYLPDEAQRDFAFSLKAFHEKSKITFIVVGVWREENRLITYNGDLTDRVFSVDVDRWDSATLNDVIAAGEALLNVQFDTKFKTDLLANCFDSVHIVQESCRRCLRSKGIFQTANEHLLVGSDIDATAVIREVVDDQGGRYHGFLMNFSDGFQQTDLEIPKWIIFALLSNSTKVANGLRLREISRTIKAVHPRGENLNNGNITQALNSAASLQVRKNIRPIIVDYDSANRNLHVVDRGFLIWLARQNVHDMLEDLGLPTPDAMPSLLDT